MDSTQESDVEEGFLCLVNDGNTVNTRIPTLFRVAVRRVRAAAVRFDAGIKGEAKGLSTIVALHCS